MVIKDSFLGIKRSVSEVTTQLHLVLRTKCPWRPQNIAGCGRQSYTKVLALDKATTKAGIVRGSQLVGAAV